MHMIMDCGDFRSAMPFLAADFRWGGGINDRQILAFVAGIRHDDAVFL